VDMQQKIIDLKDSLIKMKQELEALEYITLLLEDGLGANDDENGVKLVRYYYKQISTLNEHMADIMDELNN
jgi:hypothetical protein